MEIGRHRVMIANANIKIGSNSNEKMKTFKCLGSVLTNQNYIQEEIKCRFKAGNSCYYKPWSQLNLQNYLRFLYLHHQRNMFLICYDNSRLQIRIHRCIISLKYTFNSVVHNGQSYLISLLIYFLLINNYLFQFNYIVCNILPCCLNEDLVYLSLICSKQNKIYIITLSFGLILNSIALCVYGLPFQEFYNNHKKYSV